MDDLNNAANAGPGLAGDQLGSAAAAAPQVADSLGQPTEADEHALIDKLGQPDPQDLAPPAPPEPPIPSKPLTPDPDTARPPQVDPQDQSLTGDRPLTYEDPFSGQTLVRQPGEAFWRDSGGGLQSLPYQPQSSGVQNDGDGCKTQSVGWVSPKCEARRFNASLVDSAGCLSDGGSAIRNAHGAMVCRFKTGMAPLTSSAQPVPAPPPQTPLTPYFDPFAK